MKIDLHFHSIKTNSDKSGRQISDIPNAIKILNDSEIGVLAFTNHNFFDRDQFNEFKKYNNKNILFLPGMEIDVEWINKKRIQMNLIVSETNIDLLINMNKKEFSFDKPINFDDLINEFKDCKTIFYIDNKNNKNSIDNYEIDEIRNKLEENDNFKVIFDVNNFDKFKYFLKWEIPSLIGSDCNINEYKEKSKQLIEYVNIVIKDFDDLFEIFKNNQTYEFFNKNELIINFKNLKIRESNEENKSEKDVKGILKNIKILQKAVNVIFGPKASGKSVLLKTFYNKIENSNKCFYQPSENKLQKNDDELIKNENLISKKSDIFIQKKEKIEEKIKILKTIKLNTESKKSPNDFFKGFNKKNNLLKWKERSPENILDINSKIEKIVKNYNEIIEEYNSLLRINKSIIINDYVKLIEQLKHKIINKYKEINNKNWKIAITNKMIQKFNQIFLIHKGINPTITSFGLVENFNIRMTIMKYIIDLKSLINDILSKTHELEEFEVPIDNKKQLKKIYIKSKCNFISKKK